MVPYAGKSTVTIMYTCVLSVSGGLIHKYTTIFWVHTGTVGDHSLLNIEKALELKNLKMQELHPPRSTVLNMCPL